MDIGSSVTENEDPGVETVVIVVEDNYFGCAAHIWLVNAANA